MKKWTVILLALILAVVCMSGCSKDENKSSGSSAQKPTDEPQAKDPVIDITPFKTVGNIVTFGHYEQDNNPDNGPEPIEWIVLDVQDGKALLLSKYSLDNKPYHEKDENVGWKDCTLREWLNSSFLDNAFNSAEKDAVLVTDVDNRNIDVYTTGEIVVVNATSDTQDRVFLLSDYEAFHVYYSNLEDRMCAPTDYAIAQGTLPDGRWQVDGRLSDAWWLRTKHKNIKTHAICVLGDGGHEDCAVDFDMPVRPAFWIDLNSDIF